MTYAVKQDIDELYGPELLERIADLDEDGGVDDEVVNQALVGADDIINAYLSAQYTIPLTPIPGIVKTCAIDIAVYRIALMRDRRTDEMRLRYEDALAILEKIAKGIIGLGQLPGEDEEGNPIEPTPLASKGRTINAWRA